MANKRLSQDEVIDKVNNLYNGNFDVISEYKNSKEKIILKHKCGYCLEHIGSFIFLGKVKCPVCDKGTNLNTELVKVKIKQKFGNEFELLDEYIGSKIPIKLLHNKCGNICNVLYSNFIKSKKGCVYCKDNNPCLSNEIFVERVSKITNGSIIPLDEYNGCDKKIRFKNLITNVEFETTPSNFYKKDINKNDNGVIIGYNDICTTHKYVSELLVDINDGYKYSYGTHIKLNFKCPICGNIINTTPNCLINKNTNSIRCGKCGDGFSYPEKFIYNFLLQNNIDFIYQYSSKTR